MTVLIVGDKPSRLNTSDQAFAGSRCYPRLLKWIELLGIKDYRLINSDTTIEKYIAMAHARTGNGPIIALGKNAQKCLKSVQVPFIALPHPSGRNRQLNNPKYIESLLLDAKIELESISETLSKENP